MLLSLALNESCFLLSLFLVLDNWFFAQALKKDILIHRDEYQREFNDN